jgi:hypothetical protein
MESNYWKCARELKDSQPEVFKELSERTRATVEAEIEHLLISAEVGSGKSSGTGRCNADGNK